MTAPHECNKFPIEITHHRETRARPYPPGFLFWAEPLTYDSEIADRICARMTKGETLRTICADAAMPSPAAVLSWAAEDIDGFSERLARAREALIECWAQEIIDISDDGTNDWLEREGRKQTTRAPNAEHIQRSKLRVDARKWLISKLAPKKFGDKPTVASDKGAPVTVQIVRFADDEQS